MYVFLFIVVALLSTIAGIFLWRRRSARRQEFLRGAGQYLGLQCLEGDAAYEQAQREQREEGLPPQPIPEFLESLARKAFGPRLAGKFRGTRVSVFEELHSSSSGSHTESVFKAYFDPPLPFELDLRREGFGAKLAKAVGGQDVAVGDPAFDAAVRIKASPPEQAAAFLKEPRRQTAILQALQAYPGARICRTHVVVSRQGRLKDEELIKTVLAAIVPVAAAFSG
jgi:hypothetical protein